MKLLKEPVIVLKKSAIAAIVLGAWLAAPAQAADWPTDQVKIVVPYPPGTEPDILARDLGFQLNKSTGKVFVVENRPGANAIIGTDVVAQAPGDGKTLLMLDRLALVTNPLLYKKLPYDWEKNLKPVTTVAGVNLYLALKKQLPAKTYKEFEQLAKKSPNSVNIGTGGKGHVTHLGMASVAQSEDIGFTYVPYKGVAPAMNALLAGEVDAMLAGGLVASQHFKAGTINLVAVGADKRSSFLPDVPTVQEAGGKAGSIPSTAFVLVAPGSTSNALVAQINSAVNKVLAEPALRKSYESRGLTVKTTTPEETLAEMKQEAGRYAKLVKELGLQPE